jgi:hypothetical protein
LETADCRDFGKTIAPKSVKLVMADPVYQEEWQYVYSIMTAQDILTDDGSLLLFYGGNKEHTYVTAMLAAADKMKWCWPLQYTVVAKKNMVHAYRTFTWTTRLWWFARKGSKSKPNRAIVDTYISHTAPTGKYKWNKNLAVIEYYLSAFTVEGDLVVDFFAGGGSVARACKRLNRSYYGCEIDPKVAEQSRKLIELEPVPAIVVEPTQMEAML